MKRISSGGLNPDTPEQSIDQRARIKEGAPSQLWLPVWHVSPGRLAMKLNRVRTNHSSSDTNATGKASSEEELSATKAGPGSPKQMFTFQSAAPQSQPAPIKEEQETVASTDNPLHALVESMKPFFDGLHRDVKQ
eukprot:3158511-Prymnesium_polylepis.1